MEVREIELLFEVIGEVILEVLIEGSTSSRIPKFVRYILLAVLILFYFGLMALLILAAISSDDIRVRVVIGLVALILAAFLVKLFSKIRRSK